ALTSRGRGLPAALAMWQASRNPAHVARLVLLLTLAMSLGILSTGINATLDTSEQERARYAAGSEVRLISKRGMPVSEISTLPDVTNWTSLWRAQGSVRVGRSYMRFDVLGIEPYAFAPLTRYRDDFSQRSMGELLGDLVVDNAAAQPVIPLPGKPGRFGVWVFTVSDEHNPFDFGDLAGDSDLDRIGLEVKLRTAHNELLTIELLPEETGGFPEDGWRYFSGDVPLLSEDSYPLGVHSLWVRNRARTTGGFSRSVGRSFTLAVDEMTVVDAVTGETAVASDMEELTQIWFLDNPNSSVGFNFLQRHSGTASQRLLLNLAPIEQVGMRLVPEEVQQEALPLVVSNSFLAALEAQVGDEINIVIESQPVPARIMGVVNYFPTMYEDQDAGYVITNRDATLNFLNSFSERAVNVNEALLEVADGVAPEQVSAAAETAVPVISQALELETIRKTIKADPMALGLRSVTYFGYVLTTTLSLVGFATYFYMNARQKEALYGVLRSIGMSPRQLYGTLVLEQVVLILAGLAIGTILGVVLNQITLPGLPITFGDRPPTPPFIARNDWLAVGRIYLTLTTAFFITLGLATMLLWRTKLHRVLRVGEE
ncbi:MAG: ABC transporter permease, partial [Anaerolineales bacterium]|nr:ABC transporter permease [Anaerolineales bacterium]